MQSCVYILLQHSPSQFAKHTGNIFFMSSQAFLCTMYVYVVRLMHHMYTVYILKNIYMKFYPYGPTLFGMMTFSENCHSQDCIIYAVHERDVSKTFRYLADEDTTRVFTIIKRPSFQVCLSLVRPYVLKTPWTLRYTVRIFILLRSDIL